MARPSPGAERVVTVLEFFAARPDARFTLSELARGCGLNKATTHALLTELTGRGVLLRHPDEKRYSLGPRLVPIGRAAGRGYRAEDFHGGALRRLAAAARAETVAVRYDPAYDYATVIGRAGTGRETPVPLRWPLVPPNGLIFFAWADEASVEAWLARCPAVGAVRDAIAGLEAARRDGVVVGADVPAWRRFKAVLTSSDPANGVAPEAWNSAVAHPDAVRDALTDLAKANAFITAIDPRSTPGEAYVAAPVFDEQGHVRLALVVGAPADRQRRGDELLALIDAVRSVADELTEAVHGRHP